MSAPGETVIWRDSWYSISRKELDMGHFDNASVIETCDGPLKREAELNGRLQKIERALLLAKYLTSVP